MDLQVMWHKLDEVYRYRLSACFPWLSLNCFLFLFKKSWILMGSSQILCSLVCSRTKIPKEFSLGRLEEHMLIILSTHSSKSVLFWVLGDLCRSWMNRWVDGMMILWAKAHVISLIICVCIWNRGLTLHKHYLCWVAFLFLFVFHFLLEGNHNGQTYFYDPFLYMDIYKYGEESRHLVFKFGKSVFFLG